MSRRQACLDYAIARKRLMKLNIFVKQYEQKTSSLGMFSLSEHREKTCFYYVERRKQLSFLEYVVARIGNRGAKATQNV